MNAVFATNPLFAKVPPDELAALLAEAIDQTLLAGDELFGEGDSGGSLWILESGKVEVYRSLRPGVDRVIATVGAGAVLGEMSFLDGSRRSASARTVAPTTAVLLTRSAFDRVAQTRPQLAAALFAGIAQVLAERVRHTNALYQQSELAWLEATQAETLHLHRLAEHVRSVVLHLTGSGVVRGKLVEVIHQSPGWAVLIQEAETERISLVPYHAIVRVEVLG